MGPALKCGISDFKCFSGDECVPWSYLCDGFYDCHDGSDESKCGKLVEMPIQP